MKSFTSLCLLFKKKYRRSENLPCHHLQTTNTKTTNTRSLGRSFGGSLYFFCSGSWSSGHVSPAASRSSKKARWTPPTATVPKKPSRSETTTFDQTNSGKRTRRRWHPFSPMVFWERSLDSGVKGNSPLHLTEMFHHFLPHTPSMEEELDSLERSSPPKY